MVQLKEAPAARVAYVEHAREVDQKVADLWAEYYAAVAPAEAARKEAKELAAKPGKYARGGYPMKAEQAAKYLARAEALVEKAEAVELAAEPLRNAADLFDRENYKGWQRFFLVQHIHSNRNCASFRMGTRIGWMPDVSGLNEAEAVAQYGPVMCTICFPSAPVEWTGGQLKEAGVCEGAGKSVGDLRDRRTGFYSGNGGRCPDCGKWVGTGANAWKIPKHKPESK